MSRVVGGFAVVVTCVALLGSCALLPSIPAEDNQQQANAEMQRIAEAVKNHDTAELKKLFSQAARQKAIDLDRGLRYFLAVFPSGRITWRLEDGGWRAEFRRHQ